MGIQILRGHNGHDVYRVVTPSGVVGKRGLKALLPEAMSMIRIA
jgi:hypothetical protein